MDTPRQYLASATCVASFAVDRQIRLKVAEIERAFKDVLGGQANATNVPDSASPSIPRFTIQSGPKQLSLSQSNAQLDLDFFGQKKDYLAMAATVSKNFSKFWEGLCHLKSLSEIRDLGMIVVLNSPDKRPMKELSKLVFDRYLKVPVVGDVASTAFQIGYLDSDKRAFINVAVSGYEMREGLIANPDPRGGPVNVVVDELPIIESGIETKIDVNSKPLERANGELPKGLNDELFRKLHDLTSNRFKEFLSW